MIRASFYKWRAKLGGMDASMISRSQEREDESRRLKNLYAEACLKAELRKEALERQPRELVYQVVTEKGLSVWLAWETLGISETCYRDKAKLSNERSLIANSLVRLTCRQPTWGFGLCFVYLQDVNGFRWTHKRVYRICDDLGLNQRIRPEKRRMRDSPQPLPVREMSNETWSMDFMHDQLQRGRSYRSRTILDDRNRQGLAIAVDLTLPSQRALRCLEPLIAWRREPERIRCDTGPEYIRGALIEWANSRKIELAHIQPGQLPQHAYVERFNRAVRDDGLCQPREEVQQHATFGLWIYNHDRPTMAMGGMTSKRRLAQLTH